MRPIPDPTPDPTALIATWNIEWARPDTDRGRRITAHLDGLDADVLCVSEGATANLPTGGHVTTSEADCGYPLKRDRRKVLLWSRAPWSEVDCVGHPGAPPGRYVSG